MVGLIWFLHVFSTLEPQKILCCSLPSSDPPSETSSVQFKVDQPLQSSCCSSKQDHFSSSSLYVQKNTCKNRQHERAEKKSFCFKNVHFIFRNLAFRNWIFCVKLPPAPSACLQDCEWMLRTKCNLINIVVKTFFVSLEMHLECGELCSDATGVGSWVHGVMSHRKHWDSHTWR